MLNGDYDIPNIKRYGNKIYDVTDEKNLYGETIYQQRDDHDLVVEYWEHSRTWDWKERRKLVTLRCVDVIEVQQLERVNKNIKTVTEVQFANQCLLLLLLFPLLLTLSYSG